MNDVFYLFMRWSDSGRFSCIKAYNLVETHRNITNEVYSMSWVIEFSVRWLQARKSYRALKGLVRLQRVMRGQSVKRQTTNTMKCMQLLVRVQSQVRTRRLQMVESKNLHQQHQTPARSEKEMESSFGRWSLAPQVGIYLLLMYIHTSIMQYVYFHSNTKPFYTI